MSVTDPSAHLLPSISVGRDWLSETGGSTPVAPPPFHVGCAVEALVAKKVPYHHFGLGKFRYFFDRSDISVIAQYTGLQIADGADHDVLASALSHAFIDAEWGERDRLEASNSEVRIYFSSVANLASEMLRTLGFTVPSHTILMTKTGHPPQIKEAAGYENLVGAIGALPPEGLVRDPVAALLFPELQHGIPREDILNAMRMVPEVLATLAELASWAEQHVGPETKTAGRPPDRGLDFLFRSLSCVFHAMFRLAPSSGSDRFDESQGSLRWISHVLEKAAERVADRIMLEYDLPDRAERVAAKPLVQFIRRASDLAPATKADRLIAGWRSWLKLPEEKRWPALNWWPMGIDGVSLVPKWLR